MALVFQRRLAVPLWAIAFFAVALTAPPPKALFLMPPTTLFVIATVGLAAIVFSMARAMPWLRTSLALARVRPSGHRDQTSAAIRVAAGTRVPTIEASEPNRSEADDALDLVRMDGRRLADDATAGLNESRRGSSTTGEDQPAPLRIGAACSR